MHSRVTTLESALKTAAETPKHSGLAEDSTSTSGNVPEKILFWLEEQESESARIEWPEANPEANFSSIPILDQLKRWATLSLTLEEAIVAGLGVIAVFSALLLSVSLFIFISRLNRRTGNFDVEIPMSERPTEEVAAPEIVASEENASSHIYEEIASSPERLI